MIVPLPHATLTGFRNEVVLNPESSDGRRGSCRTSQQSLDLDADLFSPSSVVSFEYGRSPVSGPDDETQVMPPSAGPKPRKIGLVGDRVESGRASVEGNIPASVVKWKPL